MSIPLIDRATSYADRTAVIADEGAFTYAQLLADSAAVASCLLGVADDLAEARVAFLTPGGYHYVATQWGVWRAGGVAVPLATSHPKPELALHDRGLRRHHRRRPPAVRGHPPRARRGARPPLPPHPRHPRDSPHSIAAGRRPQPPRHDHLHQRHHQPPQGRRVASHHNPGPDHQPRRGMGLVAGRQHPARAAPPPHPRHRERPRLRPLVRRRLRHAPVLQRPRRLGAHRARRPHSLHGRPHHLRPPRAGVERRAPGAPGVYDEGLRPASPDGLRSRLRCPSRPWRSGRTSAATGSSSATA